MAEQTTTNYPDVLGYVTDAARHSVGVVQVAMAVRPHLVRAGRPFEVIMLIQNTADVAVDVNVTLQMPEKDAAGKKGRFITSKERLVVAVQPAEVGYITLPTSSLPDTTVSNDYTVGMDIKVKLQNKFNKVRLPPGGGEFDPKSLKPDKRQHLEELKKLKFSAVKRGGLFRGDVLETKFGIMAGKVGTLTDLNPGWVSLWTLEDQRDDALLIEKYREALRLRVLPSLKRDAVYLPLLEKTRERFQNGGYPLNTAEVAFIARLLTLILEFASAAETGHGALAAGPFDILTAITRKRLPGEPLPALPNWTSTLLRAISRDERIARVAPKAVAHFAYDDLLMDAVKYAFQQVEVASGENLGTPEEMVEYAEHIIAKLDNQDMTFTFAYMPLILGGVLIYDHMLVKDETLADVMDQARGLLEYRENERTSENEPVFALAHQIIDQALSKYGYQD